MDGGPFANANLNTAIELCKEIVGDDESKITVDILVCGAVSPIKPEKHNILHPKEHTIGNFLRTLKIKNYYGH
jgi:hypothetical protein